MKKYVKRKSAKLITAIMTFLILFNCIFPTTVKAVSLGGILLKPSLSLAAYMVATVDIQLGAFLKGPKQVIEDGVKVVDTVIEKIKEKADAGENTITANDIQDKDGNSVDVFVGPDTIFSGRIDILNANIFNNSKLNNPSWSTSLGEQLRTMVSQIYVVLRNICAIIMLIALLYTGIRILISSNLAASRAKWMELIQDWVIGLILLIFSHIIMTTIFYVSDTLVLAMRDALGTTNFVQSLIVQCFKSFDAAEQIVYLIMLIWLVYLTVVFAFSYFKRLFYVCILTILAPVVSVMYAFGKETKKTYQAWFKDYLMTVLIQPIHILMYYVLVNIPLGIANSNSGNFFAASASSIPRMIYALIAMSFIKKFEKLIGDLFGINKGVVSIASADSGRRDVTNIAKMIATAIAAAVTGGTAAAAAGAVGTTAAAAEGTTAIKTAETASLPTSGGDSSEMALQKYKNDGYGQNAFGDYFNPWTDDYDETYDPTKDPNYNTSLSEQDKKEEKQDDKNILNNKDNNGNETSTDTRSSQLVLDGIDSIIINGSVNSIEGDAEQEGKDAEKSHNEDKEIDKKNENKEDNGKFREYLNNAGKGKIANLFDKGKEAVNRGNEIINSDIFRETVGKMKDPLMDLDKNAYVTVGGSVGSTTGDRGLAEWGAKEYEDNTKKRKEAGDQKFVNDEKNINYMIMKGDLINKMKAKYPKKDPGEIEELAKNKAKSQLQDMLEYKHMGLNNIESISAIYDIQKGKGLSPESTIRYINAGARQEKNYNEFNNDKGNVKYINDKYSIDVNMVSDRIEHAQEYYDRGMHNVKDMDRTDDMQKRFHTDVDMAISMNSAVKRLQRKGQKMKVPKGATDVEKDIIKQINSIYLSD